MNKIKPTHRLWNKQDPPLMTKDEINLLVKVIQENREQINISVELGCYAGATSIILASEIKEGADYIAVDNFTINRSHIRDYVVEELLPKYKNITLLEMETDQAAQIMLDPIDFLLIDADHQDDRVEADCKNWLPKVVEGGIVVFHDYFNDMFPSIKVRVEEYTQGWEVLDRIDSLLIKRKAVA